MNEIREKRKQLGLTQIEAARACGVSRRTFQTYEETKTLNATYDLINKKLDEMGYFDSSNYISNVKCIKAICKQVFSSLYPEIECAYLFGSYARGDATSKSDIDIVVILNKPLGMKFYGIASTLGEQLHKEVDILSYEQLMGDAGLLKDVLVEGIKIYIKKKR